MNFLQIALTTKCNLECAYCAIANYRNTDDLPFILTPSRIISWLFLNVNANEWVIELTGGEPSLFEGIEELCRWLSDHGYTTLIKTNGLLEIHPYPHIKRVGAFHNLAKPPVYFDEILIINNEERQEKESYCRKMGWEYKVIGYNKENPDGASHKFKKISFVDPHGHNVACPACPILWKSGYDPYTIEHRRFVKGMCCPQCKAAIDAWRFL